MRLTGDHQSTVYIYPNIVCACAGASVMSDDPGSLITVPFGARSGWFNSSLQWEADDFLHRFTLSVFAVLLVWQSADTETSDEIRRRPSVASAVIRNQSRRPAQSRISKTFARIK